jgi:hypothetical protein
MPEKSERERRIHFVVLEKERERRHKKRRSEVRAR